MSLSARERRAPSARYIDARQSARKKWATCRPKLDVACAKLIRRTADRPCLFHTGRVVRAPPAALIMGLRFCVWLVWLTPPRAHGSERALCLCLRHTAADVGRQAVGIDAQTRFSCRRRHVTRQGVEWSPLQRLRKQRAIRRCAPGPCTAKHSRARARERERLFSDSCSPLAAVFPFSQSPQTPSTFSSHALSLFSLPSLASQAPSEVLKRLQSPLSPPLRTFSSVRSPFGPLLSPHNRANLLMTHRYASHSRLEEPKSRYECDSSTKRTHRLGEPDLTSERRTLLGQPTRAEGVQLHHKARRCRYGIVCSPLERQNRGPLVMRRRQGDEEPVT
jgi:hypothetical protein